MYRLIRFKATNLCGFVSGLGKKTVDIDLSGVYNKDVVAVLGENGTGKSTFLSMIHPLHTPSDKRTKFIVEGKEGSITREYLGEDMTRIVTKALYTPKKDGHTAKLYFTVIKEGEDPIELNPSGNVTSYNEILYTYMGVNKDYVAFASYNDLVRGIVDMTDTERKLNVSSLIPNTKRFETTYNIINDKYRDLRNTIRNISSKITQLASKDELEERVKRLADGLSEARAERDKALKKSSKLEGQLKAITGGKSADELTRDSRSQYNEMLATYSSMMGAVNELKDLVLELGKYSSENLSDLLDVGDKLCDKIPALEVKYAKTVAEKELYETKRKNFVSQKNELETRLDELQASLFSLRTQDVKELQDIKAELEHKLKSMAYYDPNESKYDNLSFEYVNSLANNLSILFNMSQVLLEQYGDIYDTYFSNYNKFVEVFDRHDSVVVRANELQAEIDRIYTEIADKEQYRRLQYILEKRPSNCVDDNCPFIANALQWNTIKPELEHLQTEYQKKKEELAEVNKELNSWDLYRGFERDVSQINDFMERIGHDVYQYTDGKYAVDTIVRELAKGDPSKYNACQDYLKTVAAILSEKAMYNDIVNVQLPKVDAAIELAENSQQSKDRIVREMTRLNDKLVDLNDDAMYADMSIVIVDDVQKRTVQKLDKLKRLRSVIKIADTKSREFADQEKEYNKTAGAVEEIASIKNDIDSYKEIIRECDEKIKEFEPALDRTRYMLRQLGMLKLEEATENHRFMVVDIMRSIISPGKGIWKEAIDIYMSEINLIANQVLKNTFGGDLLLEPFELTDKSFFMPYVFNGNRGPDISFASSSQRATVATAISMAIISKMVDKYSTITLDEFDATLSPANKEIITEVLVNSMRLLGIGTAYVITHNPENYEKAAVDVGYIVFPGGKLSGKKNKDYVEVS